MSSPNTPSILVLCVNYKSDDATLDFARSTLAQDFDGRLSLYIIDNSAAQTPSNAFMSIEANASVRILDPGENLGYFGGAAYGYEAFCANNNQPDWVIVSNPDIVLDNASFFASLHRLHHETTCSIIAPKIRSSLTGDDQNPYMRERPTKAMMAFREKIARSYFTFNAYELLSHLKRGARGLVKKSKSLLGEAQQNYLEIYAPHGSFIIFNRQYFEQGGSLEFEPFLYYEENFVAETAQRLGLPVLYEPRISVIHKEHVSTGFFKSRKMVKIIHDTRSYFLKEYYLLT